jgi:hypothetical protein
MNERNMKKGRKKEGNKQRKAGRKKQQGRHREARKVSFLLS